MIKIIEKIEKILNIKINGKPVMMEKSFIYCNKEPLLIFYTDTNVDNVYENYKHYLNAKCFPVGKRTCFHLFNIVENIKPSDNFLFKGRVNVDNTIIEKVINENTSVVVNVDCDIEYKDWERFKIKANRKEKLIKLKKL